MQIKSECIVKCWWTSGKCCAWFNLFSIRVVVCCGTNPSECCYCHQHNLTEMSSSSEREKKVFEIRKQDKNISGIDECNVFAAVFNLSTSDATSASTHAVFWWNIDQKLQHKCCYHYAIWINLHLMLFSNSMTFDEIAPLWNRYRWCVSARLLLM